jgi:hypothetical protein
MRPWQLEEGLRKRWAMKVKPEPKPIAESLPRILVHDLKIPRNHKTYVLPEAGLRYPGIASIRLNYNWVEFNHRPLHRGQLGLKQIFELKHIRTGIGAQRHCFICACGKPTFKLYLHKGFLACRFCHRTRYASQALSKDLRPTLQQHRAQMFINSKAYKRKATIEYLTKRFGHEVMMNQSNYSLHTKK